MSLACLACHSVDSPTHSFRSHSVSSSEGEGRCGAIVACLNRMGAPSSANSMARAKVTPVSNMVGSQGIAGTPRLVRSHAVSRDLVRDWNFDEVLLVGS
ncbi:uncharacterized protein M6B38_412530 [Iris pallida]|uniref:Uncharacterized protein n=1 Tax=Iris pallida TaxID=29817 RepID=A0AAX6E2S2_IRIPA|nr:Uncharacterized protein M6B38_214215 [Iris pallida]KAJ6817376.1 uncharacterized protein M6B38_412530 [Iris pallida]